MQTPFAKTKKANEETKFRSLFEKMKTDDTLLEAFSKDPVSVLKENNISVPGKFKNPSTPGEKIILTGESLTVETHWWGIDFIMNEQLSAELANKIALGNELTNLISTALTTASLSLGPAGPVIVGGIALAFTAKSFEIKLFDNGFGVHWPVTWLQWAGILAAAPAGPAGVLAAMGLYLHPFPNSSSSGLAKSNVAGGSWENLGNPGPGITIDLSIGTCVAGASTNVIGIGSDGNVWSCWYSDSSGWSWVNLGNPGNGISLTLSLGTSPAGGATSVYAMGSDGNLWACWYTGADWAWGSLGSPGSGITLDLPMGTFVDDNNITYVLGMGSDGNLWCCLFDQDWSWYNYSIPAADITMILSLGLSQVNGLTYVLGWGSDGNVWASIPAKNGVWLNLDNAGLDLTFEVPMGTCVAGSDPNILGIGNDNNLWTLFYNGNWNWANLGVGDDLVVLSAGTCSINDSTYVFGIDTDGNLLLCCFTNNVGWNWSDLGGPGPALAPSMGIAAIDQTTYVFAMGDDDNLWACSIG